jgi:uncharacterized membrane protein YfcA
MLSALVLTKEGNVLALSTHEWILLGLGAALVGIAKTAINGAGALAVAMFALALPARESTGALLPLLLVGDLIAVGIYRRHADWRLLGKVLPAVVPGLLLGSWFLGVAGDRTVQLAIGTLLFGLLGVQLRNSARPQLRLRDPRLIGAGTSLPTEHPHVVGDASTTASGRRVALAAVAGAAAGFATMTANAAGPLMTSYLVLLGLPVLGLLGTVSWFFLLVNLAKLPLSSGLGLISLDALLVDLILVPALMVGAWAGVVLVRRIDRRSFERAALGAGLISACFLVVTA